MHEIQLYQQVLWEFLDCPRANCGLYQTKRAYGPSFRMTTLTLWCLYRQMKYMDQVNNGWQFTMKLSTDCAWRPKPCWDRHWGREDFSPILRREKAGFLIEFSPWYFTLQQREFTDQATQQMLDLEAYLTCCKSPVQPIWLCYTWSFHSLGKKPISKWKNKVLGALWTVFYKPQYSHCS